MSSKNIHTTKVIRVLETFAGIGAQHKAITNRKLPFEVVKTSEWDARAVIAYASIHNKAKFKKEIIKVSNWKDNKIDEYLNKNQFSLNSKTLSQIKRKMRDFKIHLIAANIANNNTPNILTFPGKELQGIDLLTYSFPCQGLSIANMGRGKGIKEDSKSTSNLIWQIRRILLEAVDNKIDLPKYLLMENVKTLIGKTHIQDYEKWQEFLESVGYTTFTVLLSGLNHGSLQKRERVFGISVRTKDLPAGVNQEFVENIFNEKYGTTLSEEQRKKIYLKILSSSSNHDDEIEDATPNDTPSRRKMASENIDLIDKAKNKKYIFSTLTTKQDRHPNIGMIKNNHNILGKLNKRFITPREGYLIMGFNNKDFDNVKEYYKQGHLTKESLYRQGGNSIVVSVLEDIFTFINDLERGEYDK